MDLDVNKELDLEGKDAPEILMLTFDKEVLELVSDEYTPEELKDKEGIRDFAKKMFHTMLANRAIGLAGIQVGVPKKIFVTVKPELIVAINPVITYRSSFKSRKGEGCLSFMGGQNKAKTRHDFIRLTYLDQNLELHEDVHFQGFLARIIQHEMDHLDGKLF